MAIAKRASANVKDSYFDHAELLYNEHGLPLGHVRLGRGRTGIEPVTVDHGHLARQAFLDFGKGRHPAG